MKYIVFRDYKGKTSSSAIVDLPVGSQFDTIGFFIAKDNAAICRLDSQVANMYFANNDDGNGLERGKLTYYIAYEYPYSSVNRFADNDKLNFVNQKAIDFIQQNYPHFLKDPNALLFNQDFFNADIQTLRTIADELDNLKEIQDTVIETVETFTTAADLQETLQQINDSLDSIITGGD